MSTCGQKTEVYSRVCGYFRPTTNWNKGKLSEWRDRKNFNLYAGEKLIVPEKQEPEKVCDKKSDK